jgi:hypothetical protein
MSNARLFLCVCSKFVLSLVILAATGISAIGQEAETGGVIDDWSHHRQVFSNPGTREDAEKNGTLDRWLKITNSPRYQLQQLKRNARTSPGTANSDNSVGHIGFNNYHGTGPVQVSNPIEKDWTQLLGGVTNSLVSTLTGTLSSSNISSSSTLTVNISGNNYTFTASPPTAEVGTITFGTTAPSTDATRVTLGSDTYAYRFVTTAARPGTGCEVVSAAGSTGAANLYDAIFHLGTAGTTTYECATGSTANLDFNSSTSTLSGSTLTLIAATAGSTGVTFTETGTTHFNEFSTVAGTNGTDSATTFKYWNGNVYDTGSQLATDLQTALAANASVDKVISTTAGTNEITFETTHAGPYSIAVANFGAFSGVGTIGSPATPATAQPDVYPAKYGASLTSASCSGDFVVYPTGQAGSATAATIMAFSNLYSSCSGTVPSVAWAYNTGTGYAVTTSPVLSLDGTKVIFVQSNGTSAELVVLKVPSTPGGTLTSPDTVTAVTNITSACSNVCMTVTALNGADDTYSAPYYVYPPPDNVGGDTVFIGTNSGTLLRISPVLNGAAPTGTLPSATLTGAAEVASPVYDIVSGCVFAGDSNGFLYSVNSGLSGGSVCTSNTFGQYGRSEQLGENGAGIFDGPLVDPVTETIYAFVGEAASAPICTTAGANCLVEFTPTTFKSGATNTAPAHSEPLGGRSTEANPIYDGMFDNTYYSSINGVGNLYVVGGTGQTSAATLYRVPIAAGGITSAAVSAATVTSTGAYPWPSPVTEFFNNGTGTDYAFFSVNRGAGGLGCTNAAGSGCILSFNITDTTVAQSGTGQSYITPGGSGCWATGGIIIDNSATTAGASQIYFVNLNGIDAGGTGGDTPTSANCASGTATTIQGVQASQSNP